MTRLELHGPVIGAVPEITYRDGHVQLKRGDFLLMFTDGVTEAMNVRGELYSQARLVESLQQGKLRLGQRPRRRRVERGAGLR